MKHDIELLRSCSLVKRLIYEMPDYLWKKTRQACCIVHCSAVSHIIANSARTIKGNDMHKSKQLFNIEYADVFLIH